MMLMAKCPSQCIEESTVVVGLTCRWWGESACIRELCSCPLPLVVAGAAECVTQSGNCQTIWQSCVCSSPRRASDSLPQLIGPGEARRDDTLLKSSLHRGPVSYCRSLLALTAIVRENVFPKQGLKETTPQHLCSFHPPIQLHTAMLLDRALLLWGIPIQLRRTPCSPSLFNVCSCWTCDIWHDHTWQHKTMGCVLSCLPRIPSFCCPG